MTDYWGITKVLQNALLKNGIFQDEFVGVSFIEHTQRQDEFRKKTIRFCYTELDLSPFDKVLKENRQIRQFRCHVKVGCV